MERLAQLIVKRNVALAVVVLVLIMVGVASVFSLSVKHEDDILAFLPANDPDVQLFHQMSRRFGSLNLALVGIKTDDALSPQFLGRVKRLTRDLKETKGLEHVLSVTNILDFAPDKDKGGIVTGPLVGAIPKTAAEAKRLRDKILSKEHVMGNLVAPNHKAVLLYCFLAHGSDAKIVGSRIKSAVGAVFDKEEKFWGGGPFISSYIYQSTHEDMRRLTPWAVLAMIFVMMFTFRDIVGTCLALLSTSFGIVCSLGLMSFLGVKVNLVLGSMPVILFAVGSAYGTHVLARYYKYAQEHDRSTAIVGMLTSTGPTVLAAGLTTVVSMFSFISMDIVPMKIFGIFTGIGVLVTLILSLTFIPAVIRLVKIKGRQTTGEDWGARILNGLIGALLRHRTVALVLLLALSAAAVVAVSRVDSRIEPTNLFSKGSPPDRADRFLREEFEGSQFLQVQLAGDMTDPGMLRQLWWVADQLRKLPEVNSVNHIADALSRANEAMEGQRRIPDTTEKVKLLYSFMVGDASVAQLITADYRYALIHLKLSTDSAEKSEALLAKVEKWVAQNVAKEYRRVNVAHSEAGQARLGALVASRIESAIASSGLKLDSQAVALLPQTLALAAQRLDSQPVTTALEQYLRSEECIVEFPQQKGQQSLAHRVAQALTLLGPSPSEKRVSAALTTVLANSALADQQEDLVVAVATPLQEYWRNAKAKQGTARLFKTLDVEIPTGHRGLNLRIATAASLLDLETPTVLLKQSNEGLATVAGTKRLPLVAGISGLPVINRSLSRSAMANQIRSLSFAIIPVLLIMSILFRSIRAGLLVSVPTLLTLALIYGGMGLLEVHLDIGTAMLACIILGAGVDYAVHLLAEWRGPEGRTITEAAFVAVNRTGGAIWTNALMVATGFGVLTMGEAKPLQNVGGLTAVAMIVAAGATFVAIPVLARRAHYGKAIELPAVEGEEVVTLLPSSSANGRDR